MSTQFPGPRGFAGVTSDGFQQRVFISGSGTPEGVVPADPGAVYHDTATGTWYHKLTGFTETGWVSTSVSGAVTATTGTFSDVVTGTSATLSGTATALTESAKSAHGGLFSVTSAEATITCSGATSTASNLIPAGATLLGFSSRVTTLVASGDGATSFTIGDGTTADLYGTGIAFTLGTQTGSAQYKTPLTPLIPASRSVTLTATGGTFSAGVVRVVAFYSASTGPTS